MFPMDPLWPQRAADVGPERSKEGRVRKSLRHEALPQESRSRDPLGGGAALAGRSGTKKGRPREGGPSPSGG